MADADDMCNKEELPPVPQVKVVLVINNFITNTVSFLNVFATSCEEKLSAVAQRISGVELSLALLEAKLNSVPGVAEVTAGPAAAGAPTSDALVAAPPAPGAEPDDAGDRVYDRSGDAGDAGDDAGDAAPPAEEAEEEEEVDDGMVAVKDHPDYASFFRLQKLGVPEGQIAMKMNAEGVDPAMLADPERLVPAPAAGGDDDED